MLQMLKMSEVKPRENYRHIDDEAAFKELVASVTQYGILQPIIANKVNGHYEVIAGQRRYLAAKAAGLEEIPGNVIEEKDASFLATVAITENVQRAEVNPMDECDEFTRILNTEKDATPKSISDKIGKSVAYVLARVKLNTLTDKAKAAVRDGYLPLSHAMVVARLGQKEQENFLKEILDRHELTITVREANRAARQRYGLLLESAVFDKAGCKECPVQTANQVVLFPAEKREPATCLDKRCFKTKTVAWLDQTAKHYTDNGNDTIRTYDSFIKLSEAKNSIIFDSKYAKTPRPKSFKDHCEKCKDMAWIGCLDERWDRFEVIGGLLCKNASCYRKLTTAPKAEEKAAKPSKKEIAMKEAAASENKIDKAIDVRNRFLDSVFPGKFAAHKYAWMRVAIFHILTDNLKRDYTKHEDNISPAIELLKGYIDTKKEERYDTPEEWLMSGIMKIPPKKLEEFLIMACTKSLPMVPHDCQLHMAAEVGIDMEKDFLIDEAFVNTMVKAELPEFAKGLKIKDLELNENMKKDEMVSLIMSKGKALVGKTTKEIREVCKVN